MEQFGLLIVLQLVSAHANQCTYRLDNPFPWQPSQFLYIPCQSHRYTLHAFLPSTDLYTNRARHTQQSPGMAALVSARFIRSCPWAWGLG